MVEILDDLGKRPDPTEFTLPDSVQGGPQNGIPARNVGRRLCGNQGFERGHSQQKQLHRSLHWTLWTISAIPSVLYDQSISSAAVRRASIPTWARPTPGTAITSIRGVIHLVGTGHCDRSAVSGDIQLGSFPPIIANLGRTVAIPTSSQEVMSVVMCRTAIPGGTISGVELIYGTATPNSAAFHELQPRQQAGLGQLPAQADGSIVWYYIRSHGQRQRDCGVPVAT
jgi:hypothetical protein